MEHPAVPFPTGAAGRHAPAPTPSVTPCGPQDKARFLSRAFEALHGPPRRPLPADRCSSHGKPDPSHHPAHSCCLMSFGTFSIIPLGSALILPAPWSLNWPCPRLPGQNPPPPTLSSVSFANGVPHCVPVLPCDWLGMCQSPHQGWEVLQGQGPFPIHISIPRT